MSFARGWNALHLRDTDKIPHTQFISHDAFILEQTGIDTTKGATAMEVKLALAKALDYDWLNNVCEMPMRGRYTEMGHAVWSGTEGMNAQTQCPFADEAEVLAFDPVAEYGFEDYDTLVARYRDSLQVAERAGVDTVLPGGRYHTLFSACIRTFGWEMFLCTVPGNEARFDHVLEGFLQLALYEAKAWCDAGIKVFYNHDDIAWTEGGVFAPEWYRKHIFPRYARLWDVFHAHGAKVIYNADGNYSAFIDDIAAAGADGFMMEPHTDIAYMMARYGRTKAIMGNLDCLVLQYGDRAQIRREIERCVLPGMDCPGYFLTVGNHIPNGIPLDNIHYFFDTFEELRVRR